MMNNQETIPFKQCLFLALALPAAITGLKKVITVPEVFWIKNILLLVFCVQLNKQ